MSVNRLSATPHACAITANGNVQCWGHNGGGFMGAPVGQLGDGTTAPRNAPVSVPGISTAIDVSTGRNHTCAVLSNGQARCWGGNSHGQIGDGTRRINRLTPVAVSGITSAVAISAGANYSCAVLSSGTASCWGAGNDGELGDGTTFSRNAPVSVVGINAIAQIATGSGVTCTLLRNGLTYCWGRDRGGVIGNGEPSGTYTSPQLVAGQTLTPNGEQVLFAHNELLVFLPRFNAGANSWTHTPAGAITGLSFGSNSGALYGELISGGSTQIVYTLTATNASGDTTSFTLNMIQVATS